MLTRNLSRVWEWVGPYPLRPPMGGRTTSGQVTFLLNMWWNFDAWLTIWSKARVIKSPNMISAKGLKPLSASPFEIPVMADSEIGVEKTLSGRRKDNSFVTLKAPP